MQPARAVVLAAGHSSRMGHPKALTRLGDETALERVVRVAEAAGIVRPVVVVVGALHAAAIRGAHTHLSVEWVVNHDPDAGRTGSLKLGLARLPGVRRVLVWPVDHPLAGEDTVRQLIAYASAIVVPEHEGRGGHPLVLADEALAEAIALADDQPLRDVVRKDPSRVARVRMDDEGTLANLDTPADLERLQRKRAPRGGASP